MLRYRSRRRRRRRRRRGSHTAAVVVTAVDLQPRGLKVAVGARHDVRKEIVRGWVAASPACFRSSIIVVVGHASQTRFQVGCCGPHHLLPGRRCQRHVRRRVVPAVLGHFFRRLPRRRSDLHPSFFHGSFFVVFTLLALVCVFIGLLWLCVFGLFLITQQYHVRAFFTAAAIPSHVP